MSTQSTAQTFLIHIYFVLATLIGLVLIVTSSVNVVRLGLNQVLGVKPYPEFSAPYPTVMEDRVRDGEVAAGKPGITESQQQKLEEWEKDYSEWQAAQKEYNSQEQQVRREIASSLAMLVVGIPVFAIHAPYVFRKRG